MPWDEDWTGANLGDSPTAIASWTRSTGGTGTFTIVDELFSGVARSARHVSTTSYDGVYRSVQQGGNPIAVIYAQFYWRYTIQAGSGNMWVSYVGPSNVAAAQFRVTGIGTTPKFQLRDKTIAVSTSTMAATAGVDYRFEWLVNSTSSTQTLRIFTGANLHGSTPDETISGAYTQGTLSEWMIGPFSNVSSVQSTEWYTRLRAREDAFASPMSIPSSPSVTVWDGTTRLPAHVLGVWDGTVVAPGSVKQVY